MRICGRFMQTGTSADKGKKSVFSSYIICYFFFSFLSNTFSLDLFIVNMHVFQLYAHFYTANGDDDKIVCQNTTYNRFFFLLL